MTKRAREASLRGKHAHPPRLVAVSKLQPVAALEAAYSAGHRCFGENYAQELAEKAAVLPKDVQWHFIGHLQSNKVKALVEGVSNLAVVETVDSIKLANKLDAAVAASGECERSKCIMHQRANVCASIPPHRCIFAGLDLHPQHFPIAFFAQIAASPCVCLCKSTPAAKSPNPGSTPRASATWHTTFSPIAPTSGSEGS